MSGKEKTNGSLAMAPRVITIPRRVAHKGDGVCVKVRLERVGQQIHPVFLAATAVDIRVPILRGGTQINSGHVQNLPSFPAYA